MERMRERDGKWRFITWLQGYMNGGAARLSPHLHGIHPVLTNMSERVCVHVHFYMHVWGDWIIRSTASCLIMQTMCIINKIIRSLMMTLQYLLYGSCILHFTGDAQGSMCSGMQNSLFPLQCIMVPWLKWVTWKDLVHIAGMVGETGTALVCRNIDFKCRFESM